MTVGMCENCNDVAFIVQCPSGPDNTLHYERTDSFQFIEENLHLHTENKLNTNIPAVSSQREMFLL